MTTTRALLASAARTASTASPQQKERYHCALRLYLSVTVAPGTGGLDLVIRGYDKISGSSVELTDAGPTITQTGVYIYELRPIGPIEAPSGNIVVISGARLPYLWDAYVKHADASSYTYSLSAELK